MKRRIALAFILPALAVLMAVAGPSGDNDPEPPQFIGGPDTVARIVLTMEFEADGDLKRLSAHAWFESHQADASDLRRTITRSAGEPITVDLLANDRRRSLVNEDAIAALCRKEWERIHPPQFIPAKRLLRQPMKPPPSHPSGQVEK